MRNLGAGGLPSSLDRLSINGDDHLEDECLSTCLQGLNSLGSLTMSDCKNLRSLPATLGSLTSLSSLTISDCKNLRSLPATLGSLTSLEVLEIQSCDGIQSLPETGLPDSLRELKIARCPALAQRHSRDREALSGPRSPTFPRCLLMGRGFGGSQPPPSVLQRYPYQVQQSIYELVPVPKGRWNNCLSGVDQPAPEFVPSCGRTVGSKTAHDWPSSGSKDPTTGAQYS